ncbi:hypothetical protein CMI37_18120 [Candidatus Pacearchaeota archaeon]|nr:hypothetical protein [Candidatus Pacearchaeota archaeon]|tara:strand:+ start:1900 stop:2859 length:960 start_codon:yes stop_codon:yes gene_type:complete
MPIASTAVHIDAALTNISVAYQQDRGSFKAEDIFPVVPVQKQSDKYFIFDKAAWHRSEAGLLAPGSETRGANFTLSNSSYYCEVLGVHMDVSDQLRGNADEALNLDTSATEYVTDSILLKREVDCFSMVFETSSWTGSSTGSDITVGTQWSTISSTPISDVQTQSDAILKNTGRVPNCLVLGQDVYTALNKNTDILDRIKHTQRGILTTDLLAPLFGVEKVIVANAVKNTGPEGGTTSMSFCASDTAWLGYVANSPGLMQPSAGYLFAWTGLDGVSAGGVQIQKMRLDTRFSDRIVGVTSYDFVRTGADFGALFTDLLA